ncbi:hypothetical protein [Kitasatospora sp. NPDC059817]|uniref:hypothetical protein n=1 Tax=Kitasatospora sp. NPDC059817 TaxID=3346961 RepID=UPI003663BF48
MRKGQGICRTCAGNDPKVAEAAFRARVADLGGEVLEPKWLGNNEPHRVRCVAGHPCSPRPSDVQRGQGICLTCVGHDPKVAEAAFRARVADLGGEVLEPKWLGRQVHHRVRCSNGHEATPRPSDVQKGQGICRPCSGRDPETAWVQFCARVKGRGGEVLEPQWLGALKPHRVRCAAGHEVTSTPATVQQGGGICRTCAGNDPKAAEAAFRARVAELGGEVLEPKWLGAGVPHRVRCAAGHESMPYPTHVQRGIGICRTCVGLDPKVAEAAFRARVAELGGEVLEPLWLGSQVRHRIRCSSGHEATAMPSSVQQGVGICRYCAGYTWDAFYVVQHPISGVIKPGITSGDPRPRLRDHASDGFTTVHRIYAGLPDDVAHPLEIKLADELEAAGWHPARGREYYPAGALELVLTMVDDALRGYDDMTPDAA